MTQPEAAPPPSDYVRSMTLPMLRMLLKDIPRPSEYGNRQSYVLASARYCETLAGWLDVPQACDHEFVTSLRPDIVNGSWCHKCGTVLR